MINEKQAMKYCSEDISLIENYAEAAADQTQTWDVHHRLEIMPYGNYSRDDLKRNGLYYRQPAATLVFLTHEQHTKLHGRNMSEETRCRMSKARTGRPRSEETRRRISQARKGMRFSDETRRKLSELRKGRPKSEETRRRISEARKLYWKKRRTS